MMKKKKLKMNDLLEDNAINWLHIFPLDEIHKHNLDKFEYGYTCDCDYEIDFNENLIIHNRINKQ